MTVCLFFGRRPFVWVAVRWRSYVDFFVLYAADTADIANTADASDPADAVHAADGAALSAGATPSDAKLRRAV